MDSLTVILTTILGSTVAVAVLSLGTWIGQFFQVSFRAGRFRIDFGRQMSRRAPRH